ncbi:Ldh family oxidoreductase [Roseomonas hellenica]|uniref:Ldh family oxidoreductase n=1 Tax=Plastoroseomonas hellenica TaxID=2687306 RepID=A0ABS5ET94_9PROT|nr:Ldh family oxidoreductase [Plastoroseomonas hellenica]MBR0663508.1 Ldh family oxidoreductase [Plastoroseomonas hellenica]
MPMNATADSVRAQILAILHAWGMPADMAETTAEVMVETDLMGVDSHGISMVMMYDGMRRDGQLSLDARPQIERDAGAVVLMDGGASLGHYVSFCAMKLAIEKARAFGIGVVAVRNSHHFGAAGYYARLASDAGMIGLVTSAARNLLMVPTRAAEPMLGTNPIAFAAPAATERPFVLDMATTTVAGNKVKVYHLKDKVLPDGWVLDEKGAPVTDPHAGYDRLFNARGGGITPLGGTSDMGSHKGYGLAMMAHILSGTLAGAAFPAIHKPKRKKGQPDDIGHFFLALNPGSVRAPGAFEAQLDEEIAALRATKPVDPAKPVLIPGDPEDQERVRRQREGIPIPDSLAEHVRNVARGCNVPFLLQEAG